MLPPTVVQAEVLLDGSSEGEVRASCVPLSFWGGFDPVTGTVIDHRHPLHAAVLTGHILVLPHGKGSSTGSPILVDALLQGTAPAAIVLNRVDEIIALGGVVYEEFFNQTMPILVLDDAAFELAANATYMQILTGGRVLIFNEGADHV